MKKLKEWQKCLIQNFEEYEKARLTYPQIAIKCSAPSHDSVRHFVKRNKSLFEKEVLTNEIETFLNQVDEYFDKLDGFEAKVMEEARVTSKPVQIVDTRHPHQGTHLILGCVHVPFQNQKVLDGIYELMSDMQFDGLHLIGDFLDLNTLSSHDKGRFTAVPNLTLDEEYEAGNKVLDNLDSLLPEHALKTYLYGNHEDRWNRYMSDMQAAKTPLTSPEKALDLKGRVYTTFTKWNKDFFVLGKHLELLHGEYFNVHTAKKHLDVLRSSCLFAHTHRIQTFVEGNSAAFNIGWLGQKDLPAFGYAGRAQKSMWQNGFSIATIDENGDYFVEQVIVCNDRFAYGGKLY